MALYHCELKACLISTLFFLNNFEYLSPCLTPNEPKFLCVLLTLTSKLSGSPPPGAEKCLNHKILSFSFNRSKNFFSSSAFRGEQTIKNKTKNFFIYFALIPYPLNKGNHKPR